MKNKRIFISMVAMLVLSGCGASTSEGNDANATAIHDHSKMNHSGSGEIPKGLKESVNPKFAIGSTAFMTGNHMSGMMGVEAKIVGAYDTTVYEVSYHSTVDKSPVNHHKWVIHEEIQDAESKSFKVNDTVTLRADHMEGMDGAKASIEGLEQTTVYMVDFTMPTGDKVTNHKWVTENELKSIKELVNDYSIGNIQDQSASITFNQLIVTNTDETQLFYDLPKYEFFVSIAPYVTVTHPCANHSLTGCQAEMKNEKVAVKIVDTSGAVVMDKEIQIAKNGFFDLWLKRDETYTITITTKDGKTATQQFSTFTGDNTCITTIQLV